MTSPLSADDVAGALASLRSTHPGLLNDLASGDRVLWVGSGISRRQVPGLGPLLYKVLSFLLNEDDDPHRQALDQIIEEHLPTELVTFRDDPAAWTVPTDLRKLETSYAAILGTGVDGQPQDYLLWVAVDVRETYGSPAIEAGPEHMLIAILIMEGLISEVVTTNWDGLVEKALRSMAAVGSQPPVAVMMSNDSFRTARGRCRMYKVHGCAVLARADEIYREYLVAQTADIAMWVANPIFSGVVERLRSLARTRKSLMLGLSVQDYNLMAQIAAASQELPWAWDPDDPAYIFAEPNILRSQRDVLQTVYKDEFAPNRQAISQLSAAGMYSGLLLAAATLHVLVEKFRIGVEYAPAFAGSKAVLDSLHEGLSWIESYIADEAEGDPSQLVVLIRHGVSATVTRYFDPLKAQDTDVYTPIYAEALTNGVDEQFRYMHLPELSVGLALLGVGVARNYWRLRIGVGDLLDRGVLSLEPIAGPPGAHVNVVFTRDWRATSELMATDLWATGSDDLMAIEATGVRPVVRTRGVAGGIGSGRGTSRNRRQIWLSDLEPHAGSADALHEAFRMDVLA